MLKSSLNLFMYYFYVLFSEADKKYYYGSTKDLKKRFSDHESGNVLSTKHRRPLRLVYYEAYLTIENARLREQQVKMSSGIRYALNKRIVRDL